MKNIAVTGSFSSGKSFVLKMIQELGYKVFSCDDYVRKLYKDINIQKSIIEKIDNLEIFNKSNLADIVFSDDKMRKKLEGFIHPMVRNAIKDFENKNKSEKFIFTEVPLLFESGFDKNFSHNICVFCSENTRKKRSESRSMSKDVFEKITKIQISQEEKKKRSDFSVDSEKSPSEIKELLKDILVKI